MFSKQRVLTAVARQMPDRVPIDFSANPATLERLHRDLKTTSHRELLDKLGADIVDLRGVVDPVWRGPGEKETLRPDGVKVNFWGMHSKQMQTPTGAEEMWCHFPLAEAKTVADLQNYPWPSVDWFDFAGFGPRLEPWSDLAVMASGPSVLQHPTFLRGCENLLADMALAPEMVDYLMDRFTDFYLEFFERMFSAAQGRIDILRIADDLGMQDRLMIGPAQFDRFVAPRLRKLVELGHRHGVKVMFHSCGAIVPLIEPLIDLGIDILDPIQVRAKGMDPETLKLRFGDRLALHGAIDTQYLLPHGLPEHVAEETMRMIEILGPEGYIVSPSHVLQTDVPTENIVALYRTAREYVLPTEN